MHNEQHRSARIGWLRAAVLGANDGLIPTSSLIVGVASSFESNTPIDATSCLRSRLVGVIDVASRLVAFRSRVTLSLP